MRGDFHARFREKLGVKFPLLTRLGTAAVGGMLFGTLFGVLVIPALFVLFQGLAEKLSKHKLIEIETEVECETSNDII